MFNKKISVIVIAVLLLALALVGCNKKTVAPVAPANAEYQYYTADQLKASIEKKEPLYILDIQKKEDFDAHHIVGAVPTYAYPADTDELKAKLDVVLDDVKATKDPIIIVCPGGGTGAKNTHAYLLEKGISADQMFILEKGQKGWPYEELLEK